VIGTGAALETMRLPYALVPDLTFPTGIKLNSRVSLQPF
jgi:hypothetical protein